jgi:hypothetical protein
LKPASWNDLNSDSEPDPEPFDPTLLCNYCDELLPLVKSSKLLEMEERLLTISWEDPVPDNVLHRRTASVVKTVDYCVRHRFESQHLPNGLTAGWPLKPDFSALFRRILELGPTLRLLCKDISNSTFFVEARKYYKGKSTQLQSAMAQYASTDRVAQQGTG